MGKVSNAGVLGSVEAKDAYVKEILQLIVDGKWGRGSCKSFAEAKGLTTITTRQYANMARRILRITTPGGA